MKKKASHIEIIISFGIFIGLVLFVLLYFYPQRKEVVPSERILISVKNKFVDAASTDIIIFFLNSTSPCSPYPLSKGVSEKVGQNKYYITLSEEIQNTLLPCMEGIDVGGVRRRSALSFSNLREMKVEYYRDYLSFIKNLSIPEDINFEVFSDSYELKRNSSDNINIIARAYKLDVIYPNGTIEKKEFTFRIW